jgi:hypothetical protein
MAVLLPDTTKIKVRMHSSDALCRSLSSIRQINLAS